MRFYTVLSSRPQYYDRNPAVNIVKYNAAAVAPHVYTVRATYIVATGRKAYGELVNAKMWRDVAATVVGIAFARFEYTPNGGTVAIVAEAEVDNLTLDSKDAALASGFGLLLAGDGMVLATVDQSTNGSFSYYSTAKFIEFDA